MKARAIFTIGDFKKEEIITLDSRGPRDAVLMVLRLPLCAHGVESSECVMWWRGLGPLPVLTFRLYKYRVSPTGERIVEYKWDGRFPEN